MAVRPIVDRLGLLDLPERPATDVVRAREPDLYRTIVVDSIVNAFADAHGQEPDSGVVAWGDQTSAANRHEPCQRARASRPHSLNASLFKLEVQTEASDLIH